MLRALLVYGFVGLFIAVMAPISIVWSRISGHSDHFYRLGHFCIRAAGWMSGIRVITRGKAQLEPGTTYLFLSNHESNFDGPLLYYATGQNLRAVIKKEVMMLPLLAQVLAKLDFVPVDRSDPAQAHGSIDRAAQLMRTGLPFFAFPEGTRSRDGQLGDFKKGVFVLAIKAGVPIVPVTIRDSRRIQPPGTFGIRAGTVEVVFEAPIETGLLDVADRNRLLDLTRTAISRNLPARK